MEGLVKKLGLEKEEVEKAHITFLDKHPEGQMTRFAMLQQALFFISFIHDHIVLDFLLTSRYFVNWISIKYWLWDKPPLQ